MTAEQIKSEQYQIIAEYIKAKNRAKLGSVERRLIVEIIKPLLDQDYKDFKRFYGRADSYFNPKPKTSTTGHLSRSTIIAKRSQKRVAAKERQNDKFSSVYNSAPVTVRTPIPQLSLISTP